MIFQRLNQEFTEDLSVPPLFAINPWITADQDSIVLIFPKARPLRNRLDVKLFFKSLIADVPDFAILIKKKMLQENLFEWLLHFFHHFMRLNKQTGLILQLLGVSFLKLMRKILEDINVSHFPTSNLVTCSSTITTSTTHASGTSQATKSAITPKWSRLTTSVTFNGF